MSKRREIDPRDVRSLLIALTDQQIANLFDWKISEVCELRRQYRPVANVVWARQPCTQRQST